MEAVRVVLSGFELKRSRGDPIQAPGRFTVSTLFSCFSTRRLSSCATRDFLLVQQEDVLLVQQEGLLPQQEDLLLLQQEDLLLVQDEDLALNDVIHVKIQ